jgi:hypothetical protein
MLYTTATSPTSVPQGFNIQDADGEDRVILALSAEANSTKL